MNERLQKLRQSLKQQNLDGFIVRTFEGDNENVLYLSGFGGTSGVLVITDSRTFIVTDARYFARALTESKHYDLVQLTSGKSTFDGINEALRLSGLTRESKVGFEAARVSVQSKESWDKRIQCVLVPTTFLIERLRQYKSKEEIDNLRHAAQVTSRVYNEVSHLLVPGMRESDVAFELDMRLRRYGAVASSFTTIVASGPNSAIPHHATSDRHLKAGESVVMDFGGKFQSGYCSDLSRTDFVPGADPDQRLLKIYNIVLNANKAAFKALRSGVSYADYERAGRSLIEARGYGEFFTHRLGHSLGLVVHDPFDYEHDNLDIGTVITNEPGIYVEGLGGVRIEDDVVVTAKGAERMTMARYWRY